MGTQPGRPTRRRRGRPDAIVVNGTYLKKVCELLGLRTQAAAAKALGCSRRQLYTYCCPEAKVTDAMLAKIIRRALKLADPAGHGEQVRIWFLQVVEPAIDSLAACRTELTAVPAGRPAGDPSPLVMAALFYGAKPMEQGRIRSLQGEATAADGLFELAAKVGANPTAVDIARGENWLTNGQPIRALEFLGPVQAADPTNVKLALSVIRAHLSATSGDLADHWQAATRLIRQHLRSCPKRSPLFQQLQFWEALSWARAPDGFCLPNQFGRVARRLVALSARAGRSGNAGVKQSCDGIVGMAWFRSTDKDRVRKGLEHQERFVRSAGEMASRLPLAMAVKHLANMYTLEPARAAAYLAAQALGDDRPPDDEAAAVRFSLRHAVTLFDQACDGLPGADYEAERALIHYSKSAALMALGRQWHLDPAGDADSLRRSRDCYRRARSAAQAAVDTLGKDRRRRYDLGNARWNLGLCDHQRPAGRRKRQVTVLKRAAQSYRGALAAFGRNYAPGELRDTFLPLSWVEGELFRLTGRPQHARAARLAKRAADACDRRTRTKHAASLP